MFALILEREQLRLADLPAGLLTWVQVVGGFSALGIVLWLVLGLPRLNARDRAAIPRSQILFFLGAAVLSLACFLIAGLVFLASSGGELFSSTDGAMPRTVQNLLALGGAFALSAVAMPFLQNLLAMLPRYGLSRALSLTGRAMSQLGQTFYLSVVGLTAAVVVAALLLGLSGPDVVVAALLTVVVCFAGALLASLTEFSLPRVWALARLSFKEAVRRRVLYAISALLLVVLFANWYISSKPEDQVRTYVEVFDKANTWLLLFTALLLSSFSIPTDIKQQTIHTIVTKPVERFEVVLGRFLGFLALMSLVLVVVTGVSLMMVLRGVTPEAAVESLKAREPLYGQLRFENTTDERKATSVGREFEYRSYISRPAPGQPAQTARWDFAQTPAGLGNRDEVQCEYRFDVYRTTKGKEGADVTCSFKFFTWRFKPDNDRKFREERDAAAGDRKKIDEIAEKYGYYEINSLPVTDYHTQSFTLPGGLFRNASAADPERESEIKARGDARPPDLITRVVCDSYTQYVGMAAPDLYIRLDDSTGQDAALFALNYFKGAFGLWMRLALVIGLAVVLSTYLNGVVTLLIAFVLYLGGTCRNFIEQVAVGKNEGGGPLEALVRMSRRELTGPSMREGGTTGDKIVTGGDDVFRWFIRRILNLIPDVDRFDLARYVADGFNISGGEMLMSFLLLVGYLLPWAILAFYLMKWREVASSS